MHFLHYSHLLSFLELVAFAVTGSASNVSQDRAEAADEVSTALAIT